MKEIRSEKDLGTELLVYNKATDEIHVLNTSAKLIYSLYKKGKSLEKIQQELEKKFNVQPGQNIKIQIKRFLKELKNNLPE